MNKQTNTNNTIIVAYDPIWAGVVSLIGSIIPIIGLIPWLIGTLIGFIGGNKYEYLTGDKSTAKKLVKIGFFVILTYVLIIGSFVTYSICKNRTDNQSESAKIIKSIDDIPVGDDLLTSSNQASLQHIADSTNDKTSTEITESGTEIITHSVYDKQNSNHLLYTIKIQINRDDNQNIISEHIISKTKA